LHLPAFSLAFRGAGQSAPFPEFQAAPAVISGSPRPDAAASNVLQKERKNFSGQLDKQRIGSVY
jgi:hypothetical protein